MYFVGIFRPKLFKNKKWMLGTINYVPPSILSLCSWFFLTIFVVPTSCHMFHQVIASISEDIRQLLADLAHGPGQRKIKDQEIIIQAIHESFHSQIPHLSVPVPSGPQLPPCVILNTMEDMEDGQDPRQDEINTLCAIYPELVISDNDPYTFSIGVPVNPVNPVIVTFQPQPDTGADPSTASSISTPADVRHVISVDNDSHELSFLPSLLITLVLPTGYPSCRPPLAIVTTSPSWLPQYVCRRLQDKIADLWKEIGCDHIVFNYIDSLQLEAENVFGVLNEAGTLEVDSRHKIAVLDHDMKAKKAEFERQTYDCGICLGEVDQHLPPSPPPGFSCSPMSSLKSARNSPDYSEYANRANCGLCRSQERQRLP